MTKYSLIGLIVAVFLLSLGSLGFASLRTASLEADRAMVMTAVNDYYSRTSVVPLLTQQTLKQLADGEEPIDFTVQTSKLVGLPKLYEELVTLYGEDEVNNNMYPLDKLTLRSAGSMGKLKDETRLWIGSKTDPSFLITVDDLESKDGMASLQSGGLLSTLTEQTIILTTPTGSLTNPIDTTVDGTGNLIVSGSGTANIVQVNQDGSVIDISSADKSASVEYVAGSKGDLSYVQSKGTEYKFINERK